MAKMPTALILAGGMGTRLKKLYINTPKSLIKIKNTPFLAIQINWLIKNGVNKIIILTGYKSEYIEHYIENYQENHNCEIVLINEKHALGTGGALINALRTDHINEEFMLFNGDSLVDANLLKFYETTVINGTFGIIAYKLNNNNRYGAIKFDENNIMTSFYEKTDVKSEYIFINTGVYYFNNKNFIKYFSNKKKLSLEYEVIPYLLNINQKFYIYTAVSKFIDIGTIESLSIFENEIEQWRSILQ